MAGPNSDVEFRLAVIRKLDILIGLLLLGVREGEVPSVTKRIHTLRDLGLTPAEIAGVVKRGTNYVGAVLSRRPTTRAQV